MNNSLIGLRSNIYYTKDKEGKETKIFEIILLTDAAEYTRTNSGEVVRQRKVNESRISLVAEDLITLGEGLIKMADSTEKDYE